MVAWKPTLLNFQRGGNRKFLESASLREHNGSNLDPRREVIRAAEVWRRLKWGRTTVKMRELESLVEAGMGTGRGRVARYFLLSACQREISASEQEFSALYKRFEIGRAHV